MCHQGVTHWVGQFLESHSECVSNGRSDSRGTPWEFRILVLLYMQICKTKHYKILPNCESTPKTGVGIGLLHPTSCNQIFSIIGSRCNSPMGAGYNGCVFLRQSHSTHCNSCVFDKAVWLVGESRLLCGFSVSRQCNIFISCKPHGRISQTAH